MTGYIIRLLREVRLRSVTPSIMKEVNLDLHVVLFMLFLFTDGDFRPIRRFF